MILEDKLRSRGCSCSFLLLLAGFAIASLTGWVRLGYSIANRTWLQQAGIQPGLPYLYLTGAAWGIVGLAAFFWLWRDAPRSSLVGMAAALLLALFYWADRLIFSRPPGVDINTPFTAVFTLLCLLYVFSVLDPVTELRVLRKPGIG